MIVFESIQDKQSNIDVRIVDSNGKIIFDDTIGNISVSIWNCNITMPTYFNSKINI